MKFFLLCSFLVSALFADTDALLKDDFLSSLDEVSFIATKTKLNIDQTPSFVTVLHASKLKKLGIDNVYQALRLVPGVALSKESSGVPIVVFRGNTQKGEVQLMVDGMTINNAYRGSTYYYLDFPIEMIDRIEVIRGPGSVLYGTTAVSGVINIITKNAEQISNDQLFISGGTYDNYKGGAQLSTTINNVRVSLDSYYQKSDRSVYVGPDHYENSGDSDHRLKDYSLGLNLSGEYFSLMARVKNDDIGNAYGLFNVLDKDADKYHNINQSFIAQASYKNLVSENNNIALLAGYNNYKQKIEANHPALGMSHGDYQEDSYFTQTDITSNSIDNNELLIGARYELFKVLHSNYLFGNVTLNLVDKDSKREVGSLYFSDTYHLSRSIDISAGFRYDDYSDFEDSYAQNLGLVYRYDENLIFKSTYSHAHRAPFFLELTSSPALQSEKSDTLEAGIIYKQNINNTVRVNFYTADLDDVIQKNSIGKYVNSGKDKFLSSEVEYTYLPNADTEISLLASYIDAKDDNGENVADVANILSSASLLYKFNNGISLGSLLKYSSSTKRSATDTRSDLPYSLLFDQTISYNLKDLTLSATIKDLFDEGTFYTSPQGTYVDDFTDEGRTFLLKASLEF